LNRPAAVLAAVALALAAGPAWAIPIPVIQGPGTVSPLAGSVVSTEGVVTGVDARGFFLQDVTGDGDAATSDGIFVYLGSLPDVLAGDLVRVTGRVEEYVPRYFDTPGLLGTTEITRPWPDAVLVEPISRGYALPAPVLIGVDGRLPPTSRARPDGLGFWESLEGMLVTVEDAEAVGPRLRSGGVAIVPGACGAVTGRNPRGGLTGTAGDENPEWVYVRRAAGLADVTVPFAHVGDRLGDVTGILGHENGHYGILATEPLAHVDAGLEREATTVPAGPGRFHVASYNVHNLDPGDPASHFTGIARQIVENLDSPCVIALQEIQDDDGTPAGCATDEEARAVSDVVSASATYARLIDAIVAAGGPRYQVAQVDPEDDADGGAPGGNIRVAFLFDPDRAEPTAPAVRLPGSDATPGPFDDTRKPLVATFLFGGREVLLINAHLSSKHGSVPLYGEGGPTNAGLPEREAQAAFVNAYVDEVLNDDPDALVVVLGDFNAVPGSTPLSILTGEAAGEPILWDAASDLAALERYSFIYGGNAQQLDHAFLSRALLAACSPVFDIVHCNTEFYGSVSDHDPIVLSLLTASAPEPGTWALCALGLLGMAGRHVAIRIRGGRRSPRSLRWRRSRR
jgi:predicted extracellular nuclease